MTTPPRAEPSNEAPSVLDLVGIDPLGEQIYRRVLVDGHTTVDEVAQRHRISTHAAEHQLSELRALGMLARRSGDEAEFVPVDPRFALRALADRHERRMTRFRDQVPLLAELFDSGVDAAHGPQKNHILTDAADIAAWFVRLQHQAERDFMAFDRPPYYSDSANPLEGLALDRGVVWRAIYTAESFGGENAWGELASLGELGEQARITQNLPIKLAIADRRIALVSLTLESGETDALVTESQPLVDALCELFEHRWDRATPVRSDAPDAAANESRRRPRVPTAPRSTPTREQRAVLALIAAGMTDEGIARQLGISSRTLRRKTQDLMVELRAENRFQAGVEAHKRGWI